MYPTPCDHPERANGRPLCPDCQAEYDEDPVAYEEYGDHPRGRANTAALKAEMAARPIRKAAPDNSSIPF